MAEGRGIMTETALLGPWVRRFLLEYLVSERNLARNTQRSYRDTHCLLLPFVARNARKEIDQLAVIDVSADVVRLFLQNLDQARKCGAATRNQRLAAIHSLSRYIGMHSPEHIAWSGQLRVIPPKRTPRSSITYLEKPEMDALLDAPDKSTEQGRRDHALLLFLYNTGARADEAARVTIGDLTLVKASSKEHSLVQVHGKGDRLRRCPLWPKTVAELAPLVGNRGNTGHVFLNRANLSPGLAFTPWSRDTLRKYRLTCRLLRTSA
jgi:integrase/recombinase XerD